MAKRMTKMQQLQDKFNAGGTLTDIQTRLLVNALAMQTPLNHLQATLNIFEFKAHSLG